MSAWGGSWGTGVWAIGSWGGNESGVGDSGGRRMVSGRTSQQARRTDLARRQRHQIMQAVILMVLSGVLDE